MSTVYSTDFDDITLVAKGKVRDLYDTGEYYLIVATDRISAFDVIMQQAIPDKGRILNTLSEFWFDKTAHIVKSHMVTTDTALFPKVCAPYNDVLEGRSMLVRKAQPLPIECVARGYLVGSGWREYQQTGSICGVALPKGLQQYAQLPEPIFTPATKAQEGHDLNITFEEARALCPEGYAETARDLTMALYRFGYELAVRNGVLLADTKFEFGISDTGELILIDEALTPDSSRYWLRSEYQPGKPQENFDKQVLRDFLDTLDWNKQYPPPQIPPDIILETRAKYLQALKLLTGRELPKLSSAA